MLARDEKSSDDDPSIDPVIRQGMAESASAVQWDRQADVAQLRSGDEMQHRRAPRRILLFLAFLALLAVAGLASSAGESGSTPVTVQAATFPTGIGDVWVIVMENTNWSTIFQNTASAPYINSLLARSDAAYATQYYNPAGLHPSEPNYVWMEAGAATNLPNGNTTVNLTTDNDPSPSNSTSTPDHLVTYLNNKGISWKAYQEGIAGDKCPLSSNSSTLYAAKHNPMVFFQDVTGNNDPNSAYCIAHERPFSALATDLRNGTPARYSFITPNLCNDMHDSCSPTRDRIKQGDNWLSANLPTILNSSAYANGGAVFITWDEAASGDGPIGMIVLSPLARGNGYHNAIRYDHSSLLRTLAEIFGVAAPRNAASATDLSDLFNTAASSTPTVTPTAVTTRTPTPTATPGPADTVPPTVSITSPADGATVPRNSTVSIAASASDNVGVAKVEFSVNGSLACTDTTSPYTCSWKVTGRRGAAYTLVARAYDAAGNTADSSVHVTSQ